MYAGEYGSIPLRFNQHLIGWQSKGGPVGNNLPLLLSISQTMELLGLPRRTLYGLMDRGALPPSFKLGGRRVFRRADLEKWIALGLPPIERFLTLTERKR